jgi:hypothetical protein
MSWFHLGSIVPLACLLSGLALAVDKGGLPPLSQPTACVSRIATVNTWVSPYWGYNTPKIVYDGQAYYTVGMQGPSPDEAQGIIYKYDHGRWSETMRLSGIYQPPTLLLDSQRRLIVLHTRNLKPVVILRAKRPGDATDLETLPSPPDMSNAYYIGAAVEGQTIHLAYIRAYLKAQQPQQDYSMFYTRLDLGTMTWSPSTLMQAGQVATKPKTAWTYPILHPAADGLHVVASNSPDGGEGNTYNRVEYLFYPRGATEPTVRQVVAEGVVGHTTYAYAMTVGADGTIHVVHFWNQPGYGPSLPPDSPAPGVYHSWRVAGQDEWKHQKMDLENSRFFNDGREVYAIGMKDGALRDQQWQPKTCSWGPQSILCSAEAIPAGPAFMDVLRASSGSSVTAGVVLVADGRVGADASTKQPNLSWAVLPEPKGASSK